MERPGFLPHQTVAFIQALTGIEDPNLVWQVFDDTDARDQSKAQTFPNCWSVVQDRLIEKQRQKCGIFVTINDTGRARKAGNESVRKIRAVWADDDTPRSEPRTDWPLAPSQVVQSSEPSPGLYKYHYYWFTDSDDLEMFPRVQLGIATEYGTDPSVKNIGRVMRVPGFFNFKSGQATEYSPVLVAGSSKYLGQKYAWEQILEAFPPVDEEKTGGFSVVKTYEDRDELIERLVNSDNIHDSCLSLSMAYANKGLTPTETYFILDYAIQSAGESLRHRIRQKELPRIIETAYEKVNDAKPLPTFEKSDVDFPLALFPNDFQRAARELSRFIQIDVPYVAMAMLAAFSIAMGNKIRLVERRGHAYFLNIAILLLAATGERKSSLFEQVFRPLVEAQDILEKQYRRELARAEFRKVSSDQQISDIEKKLKKETVKSLDNLEDQFVELKENAVDPSWIFEPKLYAEDVTEERCSEICHEQGGCVGLASADGISVIDNLMGKYNANGKTNYGFFLKSISGDAYDNERVGGRRVRLKRACTAMAIFTQPDAVAEFLTDRLARGTGMLSRFMLVDGESFVGKRFRDESGSGEDIDGNELAWYHDKLKHIAIKGHRFGDKLDNIDVSLISERDAFFELLLSRDAQAELIRFNNALERQFADIPERADFFNKMVRTLGQIAGLLHIVEHGFDKREISLETMSTARGIVDYQLDVAEKLFIRNEDLRSYNDARKLLQWITKDQENRFEMFKAKGVSESELRRALRKTQHEQTLDVSLYVLKRFKWLRRSQSAIGKDSDSATSNPAGGGMKGWRYFLNFTYGQALDEIKNLER